MPSLSSSVDTLTPGVLTPALGVPLWPSSFPTSELVSTAASMFTGQPVPRTEHGVALVWSRRAMPMERDLAVAARLDHEGPRWRVVVSPGSVSVRYRDPLRADRRAERDAAASQREGAAAVALLARETPGRSSVTVWSRKSRSRMVETIQQLDWASYLDGSRPPVMLTLTYPGDWLAVAPDAASATAHVRAFGMRFKREWKLRLRGVWKREFQRRGAPHYHVLTLPPVGRSSRGETFAEWCSRVWAEVVGSASCGDHSEDRDCCERARHLSAGTGLDMVAGAQCTDPRAIASYFAKHGTFAEKEYQNAAPPEWSESGSVGRFWGVWGLDKATAGVYVEPDEAIAAARTMRRLSRANAEVIRVQTWAHRTVVDAETGEVTARWRRKTRPRRYYHVRDSRSGFLRVKDGPALASALARHLDQLRRPQRVETRSGAGPVGFLP